MAKPNTRELNPMTMEQHQLGVHRKLICTKWQRTNRNSFQSSKTNIAVDPIKIYLLVDRR